MPWQFLISKWSLIKKNLLLFLIVFILGLVVGFSIDRILYEQYIKLSEKDIKISNNRIDYYKDRLGLNGTQYANLTNPELKEQAEEHVKTLRNLAIRINSELMDLILSQEISREQLTKELAKQHTQQETEFRSLLTTSNNFRDELIKRLPKETVLPEWTVISPGVPDLSVYVNNTADSIERLLKLLPLKNN